MTLSDNIQKNKRVIQKEIKNKMIKKKDGNIILAHLQHMEDTHKNNKKNIDVIDGGGGLGILLIENLRKKVPLNVTDGFVTNCLLTFINMLSMKIAPEKALDTVKFAKLINSFSTHDAINMCPSLLNEVIPLRHLSDGVVIKLANDIGNGIYVVDQDIVMKRMSMIICNRERAEYIMEAIHKLSQEDSYMLAFLVNHYTTISIVFGVGVIAYTNPHQILQRISNIIVHSYNKSKQFTINVYKNKLQITNNDPIIILPPLYDNIQVSSLNPEKLQQPYKTNEIFFVFL